MHIPSTRRGGVVLARRVFPASDGLIGLAHEFTGDASRVLVTHGAFVLSRVEVEEGGLCFPLRAGAVTAPRRFLLLVPPRCVLPIAFTGARVRAAGVAGFASLNVRAPALLACEDERAPADGAAVREALRAPVLARLDPDEGAPPVVVGARQALHDLLSHPAPVRTAARRAGVAPETLSRAFSHAYGLPPKQYCHRARLFEAVLRLLRGANIIEVAFQVGFADLSRFYAQFRRLLGATPGLYARIKKRQDRPLP